METWRNPSDERSRRVPGSGRARFMRSSTQPLAPQHVSGALSVQDRINPELIISVKPAPTRFRRARAALELCQGDPWLSAPVRRRGAHVAPSCGVNVALLNLSGPLQCCLLSLRVAFGIYTSNQVSASGAPSQSTHSYALCLPVQDIESFSLLKVSLPCTCVGIDRALTVLCPATTFSH